MHRHLWIVWVAIDFRAWYVLRDASDELSSNIFVGVKRAKQREIGRDNFGDTNNVFRLSTKHDEIVVVEQL